MNVGFSITFALIALSLFIVPSIAILNLEIINSMVGRAKPGYSEDLVSLASLNKTKKQCLSSSLTNCTTRKRSTVYP
uniref:Putative secreted protein n=1 Tax=Ixodes ricinus TaxID=34613 RepID=A0A6B0TUG5_IXORI